MYNRHDLISGIIFIAIGIIIFIIVLWIEPLWAYFGQWFFVIFRIIALICIVAGIVGIITSLIPKKEYDIQIEPSNDGSFNEVSPPTKRRDKTENR